MDETGAYYTEWSKPEWFENIKASLHLWVKSHLIIAYNSFDFPGGLDGKACVYNVGDLGLIPVLGRSPGEGNGNPLQDYCLENPMDRGAW